MKKALTTPKELYVMDKGIEVLINNDNKEKYGIRGDVSNIRGNASDICGDVSNIYGDVTGILGSVTGICGDVSNICGDVTGILGSVTGICGKIRDCELTDKERENGVNIKDLTI